MDEMYQQSLQFDLTYDFAQIINTENMFALIYQISGEGGHHPSFYGYLGDCSQNQLTVSNQTSQAYAGLSILRKLLDAVPDILLACLQKDGPFFYTELSKAQKIRIV